MKNLLAAAFCLAFAAGPALIGLSAPVQASGGLWCDLDDSNMKLAIESGVTRGLGSPFFDCKAAAEIKDPRILADFRKLTLDGKLVHHWLGKEVKLSFYTEADKKSSIYYFDLVIETELVEDSDGAYKGGFKITSNGPAPEGEGGTVEITGGISCGGG